MMHGVPKITLKLKDKANFKMMRSCVDLHVGICKAYKNMDILKTMSDKRKS